MKSTHRDLTKQKYWGFFPDFIYGQIITGFSPYKRERSVYAYSDCKPAELVLITLSFKNNICLHNTKVVF